MLELLESVLDAPSRMGAPSNDSWCAEVVHTMKTICSLELRQGQPGALSSDHTSGSKVRTHVGKEQMKGHLNTNCIHSLWLWKHSIKVWVTLIIIIKILSHLSGGQNLQVKDFHFCFIYFFFRQRVHSGMPLWLMDIFCCFSSVSPHPSVYIYLYNERGQTLRTWIWLVDLCKDSVSKKLPGWDVKKSEFCNAHFMVHNSIHCVSWVLTWALAPYTRYFCKPMLKKRSLKFKISRNTWRFT